MTAAYDGRRNGLVATFVNNASIVAHLPRVTIGIARHHFTWELIAASQTFALHLISENQLDWVWHFGLQSGRDVDKFADMVVRQNESGIPILPDAIGWLECRVESTMDTGDRTIFLAEVVGGELSRSEKPLTIQRVLQLAPQDKVAVMAKQLGADAAIDAQAILAKRGAGG